MNIRPISSHDLDLICLHRREMPKDAGQPEEILNAFAEPFREWVAPRLSDDAASASSTGLHTPRPRSIRAAATSSHRKRGVAQALLDASETEFRKRGLAYEVLPATAARAASL